MRIKINKLHKKELRLALNNSLILALLVFQPLVAAPNDKIATYDKYEVFFCSENSHDATLTPLRSGPGLLDYCKDLKLNIKHYSSQDNNLRFQCESKSVYRVIAEVGAVDDKGICLAKEIKWYCDPADKVDNLTLPINTYYCPDALPKDYLNTNILVCPSTTHSKDSIKLLSGGMATDSFFCNNVPLDTVHYVAEDQIIAKYTKLELDRVNKEQGWGQMYADCPSRSAYRILTYKGEPDAQNKCQVTYDVYCDPQTYLKSPFDSKECPRWATKQPTAATTKPVTWQAEPQATTTSEPEKTVIDPNQASTCNPQQPCGAAPCGQIPTCGGGCDQTQPCNTPCGGYQMMPYTGYYMMQCQPGQNCGNNTTTTTNP